MTRFAKLLKEAVEHFGRQGYATPAEIDAWIRRLRAVAQDGAEEERQEFMIRRKLEGAVKRALAASSLKRRHPKIEEWSVLSMRPEMQAELDQRTWEALALARGRRNIETEESLQRFLGFVSSVPSAGLETRAVREKAAEIAGPVARPWSAKHIAVDQTMKLVGNLNHTVASGSAAIGATWDALFVIPRQHRDNHEAWHDVFFSLKGNWAEEKGYVKAPDGVSPAAYMGEVYGEPSRPKADDNIVMPGRAINCRCEATYVYDLEDCPPEALTDKGRRELGLDEAA